MKAIVYNRYGPPDVLRKEEIDTPVPKDDEVLVRIRAASVNPYDWHLVRGLPYLVRMSGIRKPKNTSVGVDLAGIIESVGHDVTQFQIGDEVFGLGAGSCAEFACSSIMQLAHKPSDISFDAAAAVPVAAITALQGLQSDGELQPGVKVLINGAAGGVGTFAVQIAKSFGAEVTGVCSTKNLDLVRSLGADRVIDYTTEDFTREGIRYDLILDTVGNHSVWAFRRALTPKGTLRLVGGGGGKLFGPLGLMLKALIVSPLVSQHFTLVGAKVTTERLLVLSALIESKQVTPVIDRTYKLEETAEALRYLETGHARGKVVIVV